MTGGGVSEWGVSYYRRLQVFDSFVMARKGMKNGKEKVLRELKNQKAS